MTPHITAPWRKLSERPSLEQLKKQAKDLLRDYRASDPATVAEVARAERSPNAATFALADAQRVLARAYGYPSWTALKQHVDGVTVARFCDAAKLNDVKTLRDMIRARPELVAMDLAENDENRAIHFAVRNRHIESARVLMEAGSDARKGIYPNRDATSALTIATDRGYTEIVQAIEEAEQHRREAASCPNATVTPVQERINAAIQAGGYSVYGPSDPTNERNAANAATKAAKNEEAIALLAADLSLIKACDREGASPLHVAAWALNEPMIAWLLEHRANARKTDSRGHTPLDRAALVVHKGVLDLFPSIARRLRNAGAPLTLTAAIALGDGERVIQYHREELALFVPSSASVPALTIAVKHRQLEMLRLLLDLGLDPNERKRLVSLEEEVYSAGEPLQCAVANDDWDAAVMLLDRGADPNAEVYASGTPVGSAFGSRNLRMQKLLTERGGKLGPESVGLNRQTERARRLLDGSEPITVDPNSYSGPSLAEQLLWGGACGGDPEIVRLALQYIDWPRDDSRWFRMAVEPLRIWNHGPGRRAHDYDRSTYPLCFKQIIDRHDVNIISRRGETLLHRVGSAGTCWGQEVMTADERLAFATMLLDAGARFEPRDELLQSTPLAWAARWGRQELVELYLSRGASPNEPDAEPWATPLAWATRYHHADIARLLRRASS